MGFFNKKNKRGVGFHTLSEKEIQSKLYGAFRPPHPASSDQGVDEGKKSSSSSVLVQETPKNPNLIEKPSRESSESISSHETVESPHVSPEKKWSAASSRLSSSAKNPSRPQGKTAGIAWGKIGEGPLRALFVGFPQALITALKTAFQWFLSLDLQNPRVRRGALIVASSWLFVSLFFGIHLLNISREQAMKKPFHAPVAAVPNGSSPAPAGTSPSVTLDVLSAADSATTTQKTAPASTPSAGEERPYVVQVATYAAKKDAEVLAQRLLKEKISSFIKPLSRAGGKTYYCVFLGGFSDYREAEKSLAEFRKNVVAEPFQDAFIRTLG